MKRILAVIAIPVLLSPVNAFADGSIVIGTRYGSADINGSLRHLSTDPADDIDINDELGYRDGNPVSFYLQLEHPLPLLPNARIDQGELDESARGQMNRTVDFGGSTFTLGENVDSAVRVRQTDVILYYSIFDTVANVDVGINARHLDSDSSLTGNLAGNETAAVSGWIPMLYAGLAVDLPSTRLWLGADGSYTGYHGNHMYDLNLSASYVTDWHLGINMGYRQVRLELDDFDDSHADIEFGGPWAGVFVSF